MGDRIRPLDVWRCHGCGRRFRYDERLHSDIDQEAHCQNLCDWELVERDPFYG